MGIVMLRVGQVSAEDPAPPLPLKHASLAARRLYTLARTWPELAGTQRETGLYQSVGPEKLVLSAHIYGAIVERGFKAVSPSRAVFQYYAYGAMTSLALGLGCEGPFWTLEANALAAGVTLGQAVLDLGKGRARQALVGGTTESSGWLVLLAQVPGRGLQLQSRYLDDPGPTTATPVDPHGWELLLPALQAAAAGEERSVRLREPDGRALDLILSRESA